MQADQAVDLLNRALWVSALVGAPVLVVVLLIGLLISVVQVATQLQESTLAYIPKLIVAAVMLLLIGGWMIHQITRFAISAFGVIPTLG
jgi:flagellar biosynthetic protein FliQ